MNIFAKPKIMDSIHLELEMWLSAGLAPLIAKFVFNFLVVCFAF